MLKSQTTSWGGSSKNRLRKFEQDGLRWLLTTPGPCGGRQFNAQTANNNFENHRTLHGGDRVSAARCCQKISENGAELSKKYEQTKIIRSGEGVKFLTQPRLKSEFNSKVVNGLQLIWLDS